MERSSRRMLVTTRNPAAWCRVRPRSARGQSARGRRAWSQVAKLAAAATLASFALPSGVGSAAPAGTAPSLATLVARANKLSNEIDILSQQYDGLKIQLTQARGEV